MGQGTVTHGALSSGLQAQVGSHPGDLKPLPRMSSCVVGWDGAAGVPAAQRRVCPHRPCRFPPPPSREPGWPVLRELPLTAPLPRQQGRPTRSS